MKQANQRFLLFSLLLLLVISFLILVIIPRLGQEQPQSNVSSVGLSSSMAQAEVVEILEEGTITLGNQSQPYQVMMVKILDGDWAGITLEIDYGLRQLLTSDRMLSEGEKVMVDVGRAPDGSLNAYFIDFERATPIMWLAITFVAFIILVSGWQGVRGLLGMVASLAVILLYIIPRILEGGDPVLVSVIGSFVLLGVSLYLIYGWGWKTHAAVLGMTGSLILTALLANYFVDLTRLSGFGNEDAIYVVQQLDISLNLRGLVLAGVIVGALGALDDLVITQASVAFELFSTDTSLNLRQLYRKAMAVGKDHIAAMINTLVLAYAGAALPTLLLFSLTQQSFLTLINLEFITEEIVRTLVGSIGLIMAAPITTVIACFLATRRGVLMQTEVPGGDNLPEER